MVKTILSVYVMVDDDGNLCAEGFACYDDVESTPARKELALLAAEELVAKMQLEPQRFGLAQLVARCKEEKAQMMDSLMGGQE